MSANETQCGGDHYLKHQSNGGEGHWDRMWRLVGPAWFIGNITKYAERAHDKNGLQDIDKVIHYATKYRELVSAWIDETGPPPGAVDLTKWKKGSEALTDIRDVLHIIRTGEPPPPKPPDQTCPKCGRKGYGNDEFLSPHNGRCGECQTVAKPTPAECEHDYDLFTSHKHGSTGYIQACVKCLKTK